MPATPDSSSALADTITPEFAREAARICDTARGQFVTLGQEVTLDTSILDPVREGLIRPGARIYAQEFAAFRELAARFPPTEAVSVYLGYFEVIDALLHARLRVGEPGGPVTGESQELEVRFQAMTVEQAEAAAAAGLPGCALDVVATVFDR